jgi:hypothetical protein
MPKGRIQVLEGDILRFGRIAFRVSRLRMNDFEDLEPEGPGLIQMPNQFETVNSMA